MARTQRRWMRVDVAFTRDPKIVDAGWPAAELYLSALGALASSDSQDGRITRQVVAKLGVTRWETKASVLVKTGLWTELDPDTFMVTAWSTWNAEGESTARVRAWRERKRLRDDDT